MPTSTCSKPPRSRSSNHRNSSASSIARCSGSSSRAARESTTTSRAWVPKSRRVAPAVAASGPGRRGRRTRRAGRWRRTPPAPSWAAISCQTGSPARSSGERLPRCWWTQYDARPDTTRSCHQVGGLHLLLPVERGVPVVADVVVVEDHRAGHGGEQPAVRGVGPRQPVELGVLLVVLELVARLLVDVAARLDELPHRLARSRRRRPGRRGTAPGRASAPPRRGRGRRDGCRR